MNDCRYKAPKLAPKVPKKVEPNSSIMTSVAQARTHSEREDDREGGWRQQILMALLRYNWPMSMCVTIMPSEKFIHDR